MYDNNGYRTVPWNHNNGEDDKFAKKAILEILKSQKVSLSKTRYLFDGIIQEIEDNNLITL
ncbi:hypothetical protein C823_007640 [Eubacterium plexicaudatum ASF492]|uniref:Uncharacterized protein n=1 Tax=Eubacterium plexicaudatum ASF492 TaxID=1235802 RepID=N2A4S8_9FIRM|nr:hypothetical protein C823_007640 [Eubacterium plexicaudatum ASF492]